jgi:hypothetical protein
MAVLFIFGAYQIIGRCKKQGIYILSIFLAYVFMFTFVFSYRHFQYIYNVYSLFIIISAFGFVNILNSELFFFKTNWFKRIKLKNIYVEGLIVCLFLCWLPLTPSVRLAFRIPNSPDGSFNGAMFMEEWREACDYVKERIDDDDIIISTDALGTLHYLGRIDYNMNLADYDIAVANNCKDEQGNLYDMYSGRPFLLDSSLLSDFMGQGKGIWILVQRYKFMDSSAFVPIELKKLISENYRIHKTFKGTVQIYNNLKINSG